jgi:dihydropteroate synthase
MDILFPTKRSLNIDGQLVQIKEPKVMGILNITEDSFFDGGKHNHISNQIEQTQKMIDEGAFIIDIGAQSTRPGAMQKTAKEEIALLKNTLPTLKKEFPNIIFSLDTYHAEVARFGVDQGVHMINDISGGTFDSEMLKTIADIKVPFIMMHTGGKPENMQDNPQYDNIIKDLLLFFSTQMYKASELGINDIIIDPGYGFGKTLDHNYHLLNHLKELKFTESMLLVGLSRKSMIQKVIGKNAQESLNGTTALHMLALQNGADILRVHDVAPAVEAIQLHQMVCKNK